MTAHVFEALRVPPASWKPAVFDRPSSPFSAKYSQTIGELGVELRALSATQAVIGVDTAVGNVNRDGSMRADAIVRHPGVQLIVETRGLGTLTYTTDKFGGWSRQPGWHANLRAIVLGLSDLRRLERYGIAERGQQYAGFGALPPATAMGPAMTVEQAASLLARHTSRSREAIVAEAEVASRAYRAAARQTHPDTGGDAVAFREVQAAKAVLERHHGVG